MKTKTTKKLVINKQKVSELSNYNLTTVKGGAVTRRGDCDTASRISCAASNTVPGATCC